jgi:hypothetical protein
LLPAEEGVPTILKTSHDTSPASTPLAPNEVIRGGSFYGYLKQTLNADSFDWQVVPQPGISFSDSRHAVCHSWAKTKNAQKYDKVYLLT